MSVGPASIFAWSISIFAPAGLIPYACAPGKYLLLVNGFSPNIPGVLKLP